MVDGDHVGPFGAGSAGALSSQAVCSPSMGAMCPVSSRIRLR